MASPAMKFDDGRRRENDVDDEDATEKSMQRSSDDGVIDHGEQRDDSVGSSKPSADGDDEYLRRIMANLGGGGESTRSTPSSAAFGIIVKEESNLLSPNAPVHIITSSGSMEMRVGSNPLPVAQSSPSAAAARWAANMASSVGVGKAPPPTITFSSSCPPSGGVVAGGGAGGSKSSWRDDFVAAVQANKRKRKAAAAAGGKTKTKRQKSPTKGQQTRRDSSFGGGGSSASSPMTGMKHGRRTLPTFTPEQLEAYKVPLRLGWKREFIYRRTQKKSSTADVYYVAPNGIRLRSLPEVDDYLRTASEKVTRSNFTFRRIIIGFDEIPGAEVVRGQLSPELAKLESAKTADVGQRSPITPGGGKKTKLNDSENRSSVSGSDDVFQQTGTGNKLASAKPAPVGFNRPEKGSPLLKRKPVTPNPSNGDNGPPTPKKRLPSLPVYLTSSGGSSSSRMQKLRKVAISESQRKRNVLSKPDNTYSPVMAEQISSSLCVTTEPFTKTTTTTTNVGKQQSRKIIHSHRSDSASRSSSSSTNKDDSTVEISPPDHDFLVDTCSDARCTAKGCGAAGRSLNVLCITCLRLFHRECLLKKGIISPSLQQFQCNECRRFFVETNGKDKAAADGAMIVVEDNVTPWDGGFQRSAAVAADNTGLRTAEVLGGRQRTPCSVASPARGVTASGDISAAGSLQQPVRTARFIPGSGHVPVMIGSASVTGPTAPQQEARRSMDSEMRQSPSLDMAASSDDGGATTVEIIINGSKRCPFTNDGQTSPVVFPFDRYNDYIKGLVSVFSFLPVRDLLNVRLVCKAWNVLTYTPIIWKYAHLKGCRIRSADAWLSAVDFLKKHSVQQLDVSGCGQGFASMRPFIDSAMPALSQFVQGLRFGLVTPKMLEAAAKVTDLRRLTITLTKEPYSSSEWISSAPFSSLCACRDLVELRLSTADSSGKRQRVFINGEGLHSLASLTNLKILTLFDVRALDEKVFSFLDSLSCLRVLEIGDCQCWTRETFSKLRRLVHLRRLRLEYFEPESSSEVLAQSLSAMQELREADFIKYSFDYSYASSLAAQPLLSLSALPRLHTLRLYPDLDGRLPAATWRRTMDVLGHFSRLKRLELGITVEDDPQDPPAELDTSVTVKSPFMFTRPRQPQRIAYINKEALNTWLSERLPSTVINLTDGVSASDFASTREAKWW